MWLIIVIIGNIVLMNFIIAVVSDSYQQCMTTIVEQSYKSKVDLIAEREVMLDDKQLENADWFPKYILIRRPVDPESKDNEGSDSDAQIQQQIQAKEIMKISEHVLEVKQDSVKADVLKLAEENKEIKETLGKIMELLKALPASHNPGSEKPKEDGAPADTEVKINDDAA